MNIVMPLIGILIISGIVYQITSDNISRTQKKITTFSLKKIELSHSESRTNMAKRELKLDNVWNDCEGADSLCNDYDTEYFPIYSSFEEGPMENIEEKSMKNTIYFYPLSEKEGILISETKSPNGKTIVGELIKQGYGSLTDFIPNIYAREYNLEDDINLCTYEYDEGNHSTDTSKYINPTLSIYTEENNLDTITDQIFIEDPNDESNVEFYGDTSFTYKPEYNMNKVVTTGDLTLEDGTDIELAYTNGSLTFEGDATAENFLEDGDMKYPSFSEINKPEIIVSNNEEIYCDYNDYLYLFESKGEITMEEGCTVYIWGDSIDVKEIKTKTHSDNKKILWYFFSGNSVLNIEKLKIEDDTRVYVKSLGDTSFGNFNINELEIGSSAEFVFDYPEQVFMNVDKLLIDKDSLFISSGIFNEINIKTDSLLEIGGPTLAGNFYTNKLNVKIAGTHFCNIIEKDTENGIPIQKTAMKWKDISWANMGSGQDYVKIVESQKKIVCSNIDSCIEQLETYYDELSE